MYHAARRRATHPTDTQSQRALAHLQNEENVPISLVGQHLSHVSEGRAHVGVEALRRQKANHGGREAQQIGYISSLQGERERDHMTYQ